MNFFFKIVLMMFLSLCFKLHAQNQHGISYFDKKGFLTYLDSALYFRQETDTSNYFRSFYAKSKNLYFEGKIIGASDTVDVNNTYIGLCKWYYPSGIIKRQCVYNENGGLNGLYEEFDKTGKLSKQTVYENNKLKTKEYLEYTNDDEKGIRVFEDEFSDNSNQWDLLKSEFVNSKIKIGGLELRNYTPEDYSLLIPYKIDSTNYSVETLINSIFLTLECKSGLIYGYKDKNNYNYFYVSKYRCFIGSIKNGIDEKIADNYFSHDIKGNNWNTLEVRCLNDTFYYYINKRIQLYYANKPSIGDHIGFNVNNGVSFFDKLTIKQFRKTYRKTENDIVKFELIDGAYYPSRFIQSGVMLSNNGYILTTIKDLNSVNKLFIEAIIKDTLRRFDVDVFSKNDFLNFVILKVRGADTNTFAKPVYGYSYMNTIETEKKFTTKFLSSSTTSPGYQINSLDGENRVVAKDQYFNHSLANSHVCIGGAIIDVKGNLIGILSSINDDSKIKAINIQWTMNTMIDLKENKQIQRSQLADPSIIDRELYKNLVIIKTF